MKPVPIIIVQGGQWGSEAKGAISGYLAIRRNVNYAVRTGAVNAGHTVYHQGYEFKMQQISCGFVNPRTQLVLGAGSMINPEILAREIRNIRDVTGEDIRDRLLIDYRAGLHLHSHQNAAKIANRHHKMGATGKGCSEAITAKIRERGNANTLQFKEWLHTWGQSDLEIGAELAAELTGLTFTDTEKILNQAYDQGARILIEATQGTLLDLHLGPYPYTTHKQTIAGQWITECGLSPNLEYEIVLVCRTYPIRVAGNSGPMPCEIGWDMLAGRINSKLVHAGLPLMINESAMIEFDLACQDIGKAKYLPNGLCPATEHGNADVQFWQWDDAKRAKYPVVLSELHKDALNAIGANSLTELKKLFEVTTVTRKLRRIADWDGDTMRASIRQNRPNHVILTFLNYEFPQYTGCTVPAAVLADPDVQSYVKYIEGSWGCEVSAVTTGPGAQHVLPTHLIV